MKKLYSLINKITKNDIYYAVQDYDGIIRVMGTSKTIVKYMNKNKLWNKVSYSVVIL